VLWLFIYFVVGPPGRIVWLVCLQTGATQFQSFSVILISKTTP